MYLISNFYLSLAIYLNSDFVSYKALYAENIYMIGSLENSNTEISDELVKLIRAQQAFNGNAKMLETERKATELLMS